MKEAVLGIGGNLGDREDNIAKALSAIERLPGTNITHLSSIYETEPFDVLSEQENYLNCCVKIETSLSPEELLDNCLAIETGLGRVRQEYHGARTVDIDLLLYEGAVSDTDKLRLPHPEIRNRAFVLVPMSDIFPKLEGLGFSFETAFQAVDKTAVWLYK